MAIKITSIPGAQPLKKKEYDKSIAQNKSSPDVEEGWAQYGLRNVALLPKTLWKAAGTGFGLGDAAKELANAYEAPEWVHMALNAGLPTSKQADERLGKMYGAVLPEKIAKYLTEERPEDEWPQYLGREAAAASATGALKGVVPFARYGFGQLASRGGGELLGNIGKYAGKLTGKKKHEVGGEIAGRLLGSVGGGLAAQKVLPSQFIPKRAFEKDLSKAKTQYKEANLALPKEQVKFEKTKLDRIANVRNEVKDYDAKIKGLETIQKKSYNAAKKFETGDLKEAKNIDKSLNSLRNDLDKGLISKDKKIVSNLTKDLNKTLGAQNKLSENVIVSPHTMKPEPNKSTSPVISLTDAKKIQKNLNGIRYDRHTSPNVKRSISGVIDDLNTFIKESGSKEHNLHWQKAENATQQLKKLQKTRKDFIGSKKQEIGDIKSEKFDQIFASDLRQATQRAKEALNVLGKKDFDRVFNSSLDPQTAWVNIMDKLLPVGRAGLIGGLMQAAFGGKAGLAAATLDKIGRSGFKEFNIAKNTYRHDPALFKEWGNAVADAMVNVTPSIINQLNKIGEKAVKKDAPKRKIKIINIGS